MRVRAIKRGFFGGEYRRPGDKFDCPSDAFSSNWMEKLTKGKPKPLPEPENGYVPLEIPSLMSKDKT
jgi:hypothetical protein